MAKRKACTGSTTIAMLLVLSIVVLTVFAVYFFLNRTWWFPESITTIGNEVDQQFVRTLIACGVVFVLSQIGLAYAIFRFRDRGSRSQYSHGNNTLEAIWTVLTIVTFIGVGLYGRTSWAEVHFRDAHPGAVKIQAMSQQFAWNFRYPGADGSFGRTILKENNNSGTDPFSVDNSDPTSKDDVLTAILGVPVNEEVELTLFAKDVIHSFFVRELRLKQDAVPGMRIPIHFTATKVGEYELYCAELCGLGHQRMRSVLKVMTRPDYEKWLKEQAAE